MSELENKWIVYFGYLTFDRTTDTWVEEQYSQQFPTLFGAVIYYISKLRVGIKYVHIERLK